MAQAVAVQNKNVISSWGKVLYGAAGKSEALFDHVIKHLEAAAVPDISWGFADIGAKKKLFGGAKGEIRRSLSIRSSDFQGQTHRVGAEDYGTCLSVSRYLTTPNAEFLPDTDLMNIFELENLVVYNTVAQNAVVDAVRDLMKELGQDSSDIDTKSKGYLDVW